MPRFKKIVFLPVVFLGVLVFSQGAWAGCCVSSDKKCSSGEKQEDCSAGFTFSPEPCSVLIDAGECTSSGEPSTPDPGSGGSGGGGGVGVTFPNPIPFTTVSEVLGSILSNMMGIIALIAIIFIVIGGILYMTSAGNKEQAERAKKTWTAAVVGLVIALLAPTFLKEIKEILGGPSGSNPDEWVSQALTIKEIAVNVLKFLLSLVGIFGIIAFVVGGFFYLTAYGDEDRAKTGKSIATYAVLGIIVALSALIIVRQVASLIGGNI